MHHGDEVPGAAIVVAGDVEPVFWLLGFILTANSVTGASATVSGFFTMLTMKAMAAPNPATNSRPPIKYFMMIKLVA